MVTGVSYEDVLKSAEQCGYIFGSGTGVSISHVFHKMDWDVEWKPKFQNVSPAIIAVASLNNKNWKHAVVYSDGEILDPTKGDKIVSLDHAKQTASYTYSDFIQE